MKQVLLQLPENLHNAVKHYAIDHKLTINQAYIELLKKTVKCK